jgi:hypothetical protein
MDLSPSRVKPTAITLVCAVFPAKHAALKEKTGFNTIILVIKKKVVMVNGVFFFWLREGSIYKN